MTFWYTADLHFGHESIIKNAQRPFSDADHMDAILIERMWEKVGPDDELWIVGDFAFGAKAKDESWLNAMFGQLPGAKRHLIIGNHDGPLTLALPWDSVSLIAEANDPKADRPVTLCHYPMITWNYARKGALHLFGHVHGSWNGTINSVNVGVDVWEYYPMTIKDAARRAKGMAVNRHWHDVEPRA